MSGTTQKGSTYLMATLKPSHVVNTLTGARLLILGFLIWSIVARPAFAWVLVVAIVVADIFDGVLARRLSCDTNTRRSIDAVVDRICIHASFGVAVAIQPAYLAIYAPLLIRDVLALSASGVLLHRRKLLLMGGHWHKLSSLTCAAFGVAILALPAAVAFSIGWGAVLVNYALLCDYAGGYFLARHKTGIVRFRITRLAGVRFVAEAAVGRSAHAVRATTVRHAKDDLQTTIVVVAR
jgi:phosphatidylglycerophosphate synthase